MGTLYVVATPIGNLGDMTKRAIDILREADYILVEDTRQTIKLLNHFNIKNKMVAYHKFNEKEKVDKIITDLENEKNIALVSDAGTPCISDPGYIIVKEAREKNLNVITIPGCSAVISALAVGGLDTSSFSFYGFTPSNNKDKKELFNSIKHSKIKTKVLYESPKRVLKLLGDLKNEMPGCEVCVCSELTKVHEKYFYGKIEDVYKKMGLDTNSLKGEYVILISNSYKEEKNSNNDTSIESLIVDSMVKNKISLKEAIKKVNDENKSIKKNDIYEASLNLKKLFK